MIERAGSTTRSPTPPMAVRGVSSLSNRTSLAARSTKCRERREARGRRRTAPLRASRGMLRLRGDACVSIEKGESELPEPTHRAQPIRPLPRLLPRSHSPPIPLLPSSLPTTQWLPPHPPSPPPPQQQLSPSCAPPHSQVQGSCSRPSPCRVAATLLLPLQSGACSTRVENRTSELQGAERAGEASSRTGASRSTSASGLARRARSGSRVCGSSSPGQQVRDVSRRRKTRRTKKRKGNRLRGADGLERLRHPRRAGRRARMRRVRGGEGRCTT